MSIGFFKKNQIFFYFIYFSFFSSFCTGTNEKVKFQIETPEGEAYTYLVTKNGTYIVYPLTQGSGTYQLTLYEAASVEENLYATAFTQSIDVTIG